MIHTMELLRNFMYNNSDVKLAAYECGLANLIHRMWAWCLVDTDLLTSALSLLVTFTANCSQGKRYNTKIYLTLLVKIVSNFTTILTNYWMEKYALETKILCIIFKYNTLNI